jgi:hypothetical protein
MGGYRYATNASNECKAHVDPDAISAAWCITINASQGSQFPMMVAWFHPGFDMEHERYSGDNIWLREHLYRRLPLRFVSFANKTLQVRCCLARTL